MSPISTSSQSSIGAATAPNIHDQWSNAPMGQSTAYDSYFPVAAATQTEHAAAVFHKTYHMS